jgi:hypothetical protein
MVQHGLKKSAKTRNSTPPFAIKRYGGQFERLIGIFKATFRKTVGGGMRTFSELEEVVLDVHE